MSERQALLLQEKANHRHEYQTVLYHVIREDISHDLPVAWRSMPRSQEVRTKWSALLCRKAPLWRPAFNVFYRANCSYYQRG